MADATLKMLLLGEDRSASKALKGVGGAAEDSGKHLHSFGKIAAGVFAGGALLGGAAEITRGLIDFGKASVDEGRESQKVNALTAAAIKSTGSAAHVSAKQIGDLSTAISNKVGIDDEAIQSGANLLLTFTNVRNEVGKGNDVFNRATQTATDMSAALGQPMKSSVMQLGKALNDPIKGITALTRVGVSFTDQQKKQIKTLTTHGNALGAQKIILKELNKEFGGAAASQATAGQKASVAWKNFQEMIGNALIPIIDKLATFFTDKIIPAISAFIGMVQSGKGPIGAYVAWMHRVGDVVKLVGHWIGTELVPFIKDLVHRFTEAMGGTKGFGKSLQDAHPFLVMVGHAAQGLWNVLKIGAQVAIPLIVNQFKMTMRVLGFLGRAATALWNVFFQPSLKMIVRGLAELINVFAKVIHAIALIPGPQQKAMQAVARSLDAAAGHVHAFSDSIRKIPTSRTVRVTALTGGAAAALAGIIGQLRAINGAKASVMVGITPRKHRASGGAVMAGQSYIVNERGMETFIPSVNGTIASNYGRSPGAAGGGSVTNNFYIDGALDANGVAKQIRTLLLHDKRTQFQGRTYGLA